MMTVYGSLSDKSKVLFCKSTDTLPTNVEGQEKAISNGSMAIVIDVNLNKIIVKAFDEDSNMWRTM